MEDESDDTPNVDPGDYYDETEVGAMEGEIASWLDFANDLAAGQVTIEDWDD